MEEHISFSSPVVPPTANSNYCTSARIMSSEIVEIGEDSRSGIICSSIITDVYVAVGKDDLYVVKWALDHAVSPGAKLFLVHVSPPLTYISTPVGRLSRNQLSQDQVRFYVNEEHNRRRNLLQKYIRLCNDAKVTVDTVVLESNDAAKAILDLIPVLNIAHLVMGTTRSRLMMKKLAKGEFVKKNSPDYCEVTIVDDGKKQKTELVRHHHSSLASDSGKTKMSPRFSYDRKFFECVCFSGK